MAGTRTRRLAACAAAAVAAATVLVLGVSPAVATVVDSGHYTDAYSFSYDDCGFAVDVSGTASGHFRIREGKGKLATAFFVNDNFSYTETHTNPATGAFFTVTGNGVFNEVKATPVVGTIFEFEAVEAGQPFVLYDSDGNLVLRDRGSLHHHSLFDTEGDEVPGGVEIEYLGADVHGPHFAFENDICPIITDLIG
ncbi:MAG TPA: hypothetical protein VFR43_00365 [Gaiellaceae bacterium]|nr:hypothetical protein [Gaiellaceae bacterium]